MEFACGDGSTGFAIGHAEKKHKAHWEACQEIFKASAAKRKSHATGGGHTTLHSFIKKRSKQTEEGEEMIEPYPTNSMEQTTIDALVVEWICRSWSSYWS